MSATKPVLLASDVHLGATPPAHRSAFVEWLRHAAGEASRIIINGDLFDFWYEYRWGVTRGHDDVLALLREIVDAGLPITMMGGNHDWWGGRYLRDEIGLEFLTDPVTREIGGRTAFLAHGDGLGRGDLGYLALRTMLRSPLTRFAFGLLPVPIGDRIACGVSNTEERWDQWGERQEARSAALEGWARAKLASEPELDLVLLGHTHLPMVREVEPGRWYVNSGDWVFHQTFVTLQADAPPTITDWRERSS